GLGLGAGALALAGCARSDPAPTSATGPPPPGGTTGPAVAGPARAPVLLGIPTTAPPQAPGTRPDPSRPEGTDLLPQIEHIVVLMMENHSFDDHFGMLGRGDGLTLGPDGAPTNANPDASGQPVRSFHQPSTSQTGIH